jgi:hypothetical protein
MLPQYKLRMMTFMYAIRTTLFWVDLKVTFTDKVCIGNAPNQDLDYPWLIALITPPLRALVPRLKTDALYCDTDLFVYTSRGMMDSDVSRWQLPEGDLYKMAPRLCTSVLLELDVTVDAGRRG